MTLSPPASPLVATTTLPRSRREPQLPGEGLVLVRGTGTEAGTVHLVAQGDLDTHTSAQLRDVLVRELTRNRRVTLDLSGLQFVDSAGLHAVHASRRRADLLGHELLVVAWTSQLVRLLEITGLTGLLAPVDDRGPDRREVTPAARGRLAR